MDRLKELETELEALKATVSELQNEVAALRVLHGELLIKVRAQGVKSMDGHPR